MRSEADLRYFKILMVALSLMIIMSACESNLTADRFREIQKKLFEMKSYKCTSEIKIISNKNSIRYLVRQAYLHPSRFKVEVIEPEFMKGIVTLTNANETSVSNPNLSVNNTYISENIIKLNGNNMFLSYFFNNYVSSEKSDMKISNEKYILKAFIPSETDYMETEVLTVDRRGCPESLEIFDKQGRLKIEIKYKEFVMNPKIDEMVFN